MRLHFSFLFLFPFHLNVCEPHFILVKRLQVVWPLVGQHQHDHGPQHIARPQQQRPEVHFWFWTQSLKQMDSCNIRDKLWCYISVGRINIWKWNWPEFNFLSALISSFNNFCLKIYAIETIISWHCREKLL